MKKTKKHYVCNACGSVSLKWSGQCPECLEWSTITEEFVNHNSESLSNIGRVVALENFVIDSNASSEIKITVPIKEVNHVLGGGLVCGAAILLGGDPGIGKSTLLLQLMIALSNNKIKCLYVSGEESSSQVKLRAARLGIISNDNASIIATINVEDILATLEQHKGLQVVIIDSIQSVYSSEIGQIAGTVSQIKGAAQILITYAKTKNISIFFVGHVTKDGNIAGPKVLEHMVDTVLYFEGDYNYHFRLLRSIKNRFGPVNEIGVFEMTQHGLVEVNSPSQLFLSDRIENVSGSSIFSGIEGSRPILVEIQALIAPSNIPTPRRTVVGWDYQRLSMILAVLAVRYGLNLANYEVYLTIVGGLKIIEPAADLAIAAALISAALNKPIKPGTIFFGEVGLSGEVRKVINSSRRINEAVKTGFPNIVCHSVSVEEKANIIGIKHIKQLKDLL